VVIATPRHLRTTGLARSNKSVALATLVLETEQLVSYPTLPENTPKITVGNGGRVIRVVRRAAVSRGRINPHITSRGAWKTFDTYRGPLRSRRRAAWMVRHGLDRLVDSIHNPGRRIGRLTASDAVPWAVLFHRVAVMTTRPS